MSYDVGEVRERLEHDMTHVETADMRLARILAACDIVRTTLGLFD